jgi:hypothetical protein
MEKPEKQPSLMEEAERIAIMLHRAEAMGFRLIHVPRYCPAEMLIRYAADLLQIKHCDQTRRSMNRDGHTGDTVNDELGYIAGLAVNQQYSDFKKTTANIKVNETSRAVLYLSDEIYNLAHNNFNLATEKLVNNSKKILGAVINV